MSDKEELLLSQLGTFTDGFTQGLFQENDVITVQANASENGMKFLKWIDKNAKRV